MNLIVSKIRSIKKILFGYDIFISYSREDSLDYAYAIARHFIDKNYECYIDQISSTKPGKEISSVIINAIIRSKGFILIGSIAAQKCKDREPIAQEIDTFLGHNDKNFLIPINVNAAINIENAKNNPSLATTLEKKIVGLALINETEDNFIKKEPGKMVLERIEKALTFTKKAKKLRNIVWLSIISVGLLSLAGVTVAAYTINGVNKEVDRAKEDAKLRLAANRIGEIPLQDPFSSGKGALLSIELINRFDSIKSHSIEAINALRRNLNLLPRYITHFSEFYGSLKISNDGEYFANWWSDYPGYKTTIANSSSGKIILAIDDQSIIDIEISPAIDTSKRFCAILNSRQLSIYNLLENNPTTRIKFQESEYGQNISFSYKGDNLLVSTNKAVYLYNTNYNKEIVCKKKAISQTFLSDSTIAILLETNNIEIYKKKNTRWVYDKTLKGNNSVNKITNSPNGNFILTIQDGDQFINIYNVLTGKLIRTIKNVSIGENRLGINDNYLYTVLKEGKIQKLEWNSNQISTIENFNHVSADGKYIWQRNDNSSLQLILQNSEDEKQKIVFKNGNVNIYTKDTFENIITGIYPVGKFILLKTFDNSLFDWENPTYSGDIKLLEPENIDKIIAISSNQIITQLGYRQYKTYDIQTMKELSSGYFAEAKQTHWNTSFSSDGKYSATGTLTDSWLVERRTNRKFKIGSDSSTIYDVSFSPDNKYFISAGENGLRIYSTDSWREVFPFSTKNAITMLKFSHKGNLLALSEALNGNDSSCVRILNLVSQREVARFFLEGDISFMEFSPNDSYLAASSEGKILSVKSIGYGETALVNHKSSPVIVWKISDSAELFRFFHGINVKTISFSEDEQLIASYSNGFEKGINEDSLLLIRSLLSNKITASLKDESASEILFSPNNKYLIVGNYDNTIRVYATINWQLDQLLVQDGSVNNLKISDDNRYLFASTKKYLYRWVLNRNELIDNALKKTSGKLTSKELAEYFK